MDLLSSTKTQSWLSWFLRGVLILVFLILFSKVTEVQIIKGQYFRSLSEENRIKHIPLPAPRGKILARGGEALVENEEIKKRIEFDTSGKFQFSDNIGDAPSEEIVSIYKRRYVLGEKFAHVSGYLGEIGQEDVGKINPDCPEHGARALGALVGKTGLEEKYECILTGISGEELVEVDTMGKKIRTLGKRDPMPGQNIVTTIDFGLQENTALEMGDAPGGIIVTDPEGQILSLYSSPSFDPNLLSDRETQKKESGKVSQLLLDENHPFFNRVISGLFHPGSVFKPLIAIAALTENKIDKNYRFTDTGAIEVKTLYGDFTYTNWYFTQYGGREGEIDLTRALARSTDTFFYKIGEFLGPEKIAFWAGRFGLDQKSGIDLPGEAEGLIPTPEWKKRVKNESWFLGNTYHISIGQGDVAVTPIEINRMIAAISTGTLCTPRLVIDNDTECGNLNVEKKDRELVREGMHKACSEGGTAYTFFDFESKFPGVSVACKTGTAETGSSEDTHAWFTFFAPIEKPEIVVTVLVEKGGEGSKVAGPIARKIADYYFGRK